VAPEARADLRRDEVIAFLKIRVQPVDMGALADTNAVGLEA